VTVTADLSPDHVYTTHGMSQQQGLCDWDEYDLLGASTEQC
jgi:hypothetical protein